MEEWLDLFANCAIAAPVEQIRLSLVSIANPPYSRIAVSREPSLSNYQISYRWQEQSGDTVESEERNGMIQKLDRFRMTRKRQANAKTELLFVERCLAQCQPGEVLCVLLPNGALANSEDHYFRCWLLQHSELLASIQFPQEAWQAECKLGLITSVLLVRRKSDNEELEERSIFMAVIDKCGYDSRGRRTYKRMENRQIVDEELSQVVDEFCHAPQSP